MYNRQFYADHLKSNSDDLRQAQPEAIPLVEQQYGAVNIPRGPGNAEITPSEHTEHSQARKGFGKCHTETERELLDAHRATQRS